MTPGDALRRTNATEPLRKEPGHEPGRDPGREPGHEPGRTTAPQKKPLIQKIVNVFETGTPEGRYDRLVVYDDGVNGSRQITYGRSQTTEQGNLARLINMYVQSAGAFADDFRPFLERIGKTPLADDRGFEDLLIRSAREDPIMRDTQDRFFDQVYWEPACLWFRRNAFTLALGLLVTYDSYVHSGGIPMFLRRRFLEPVPANGGDEIRWLGAYVEVRHHWLQYHERELLRKTAYRTRTLLHEMARGNWELELVPIVANGVEVG